MHLPTLPSLTSGLRTTVLRFPIPTLFAAITTGLLVATVDQGFDEDALVRFALLSGLGFVSSLLWDLIVEERGSLGWKRGLGHSGVVVMLILYSSFIMPELLEYARPPFWYSYFILLFVLHLGIALVPTFTARGSQVLWRFNLNCFLRYFFSSVNAALLFGGLALALLSVDKLFELGIDEELYPQLWVLCAFFAHPMLFLGGLPRLSELKDDDNFPKPLRFSLCFIGLPLVALYLLILYTYVAKIGIQWSWPNGWVAMPIFVLAVISLLTYVLSFPLPKTETWASFYHRWLYRLLLPLSIVLFMALQVRLSDYGMTINRYLGLALAVWLFGISLAYIIRPRLKIGWMPFSLLIVALFSIYAGPLGASGWSERAQIQRIRSMAAQLGVIKDNVFMPSEEQHEAGDVVEFESSLRYIFDNFGPQALKTELANYHKVTDENNINTRHGYYMTNRVMEYLKLDDDLEKTSTYFYANKVIPTHGHTWMIDYNFYGYRSNNSDQKFNLGETSLSLSTDTEANTLNITSNDEKIISLNIAHWAADVKEAVRKHGNTQQEPLVWNAEGNGWRFTFVCTNAQLKNQGSAFQSGNFKVFLSLP